MTSGPKSKVRRVLSLVDRENPPAKGVLPDNPLYGVAMLKIALELKKSETAELSGVLENVVRTMRLPEQDFRAFLVRNGGLLKAIAQKKRG